MAFVALSDDYTDVIAIFNMPQSDPTPPNYYGEISNKDPRLIEFVNKPIKDAEKSKSIGA